MKHVLLAALTLGVASLASPARPHQPVTFCRVVILRDYEVMLGYYSVPVLAPECPVGAVGRVRKSSTLNTRAQGAPYQPVRPAVGAWTVTTSGDDIPNGEQFRFAWDSWEWQWWDGRRWLASEVF